MLDTKIKERISFLESIKNHINAILPTLPPGNLRIAKHRSQTTYYHITKSGDTNGAYIRKDNYKLAQDLSQKSYLQHLLYNIEAELNELVKLENIRSNFLPEKTIYAQSHYRQQLISPIMLPDEMYVEKWMSESYRGKPFSDTDPEHYTDRNERVRSKTEIAIANALNNAGIPYKYEKPIYINGVGNIYIDFTILLVKQRREVYWEHFGRMSDENYVNSFLTKLSTYSKNGIIPGQNLFMTFEDKDHPLGTREIQTIVSSMLL